MDKRYTDKCYKPDAVTGLAALLAGCPNPDAGMMDGSETERLHAVDGAADSVSGSFQDGMPESDADDLAQPKTVSSTHSRSAVPSFSGMISRRFLTVY